MADREMTSSNVISKGNYEPIFNFTQPIISYRFIAKLGFV